MLLLLPPLWSPQQERSRKDAELRLQKYQVAWTPEPPARPAANSPGHSRVLVCLQKQAHALWAAAPEPRVRRARGPKVCGGPRTCCAFLWDCRLDWSLLSSGAPFLDSLLSSQ